MSSDGKAAAAGVLADPLGVRRDVDAEEAVGGDVAVDPLDVAAEREQDVVGLGGDALELSRRRGCPLPGCSARSRTSALRPSSRAGWRPDQRSRAQGEGEQRQVCRISGRGLRISSRLRRRTACRARPVVVGWVVVRRALTDAAGFVKEHRYLLLVAVVCAAGAYGLGTALNWWIVVAVLASRASPRCPTAGRVYVLEVVGAALVGSARAARVQRPRRPDLFARSACSRTGRPPR